MNDVVTETIYQWIDSQDSGKTNTANRCSAATGCVRKRWYQNHGFPGEKIDARARVNFSMGDIAELAYKYYVEKALVGSVYSEVNFGLKIGEFKAGGTVLKLHEQKTLTLTVGDLKIPGHPDGLGKRISDKQWELIEFKSASTYGFDEFLENGPGDYLKQAHALMLTDELTALGVRSVRFFYLKKETGHLASRFYQFDPELADRVKLEFLQSNMKDPPPQPYGFVEKKMDKTRVVKSVPWQCGYCAYLKECRGPHEVEFKSGKPVYVFN